MSSPDGATTSHEMAPPWARFPEIERHSIGWRMGEGEQYLDTWGRFVAQLPEEHAVRLAYLRRHPAAPVSWADYAYGVLAPRAAPGRLTHTQRQELRQLGLIAVDIAFPTWLSQQRGVRWPWEDGSTPTSAARYATRELWFWSRQVAELRAQPGWSTPKLPMAWRACASSLRTGAPTELATSNGLMSLANMLCAGRVIAPWQQGLSPDDFTDSMEEDDMGAVDAFVLWGTSAFDDAESLQQYLATTSCPPPWRDWVLAQLPLD